MWGSARHMICTTWAILADQGYSYLTTLNTANPPARLVFVNSPPDPSAIFFSVAISQSGDKFSLLDAPMEIAQTLGNNLRSAFPHKIASDRAKEDGIYVIELKRGDQK
ncbi:hypothetical protein EW026_g965 [Hermanssonia centrifuga]|uniref:Uncharacterized protein n=1 Tax=Hermanssonia centrifuga TaxID=98765 RepID=A0A4S4KTL0_9APHY|nr:hypothetical protein EW026_g965 [Hermanssonia centrifuga]